MGNIEEITRMRQQGKSEQEIARNFQQRGLPDAEISNLISQTQIKEAVNAPPQPMQEPQEYQTEYFGMRPTTEELGSMQPSMSSVPEENYQESFPQSMQPPSPMPEMQEEYAGQSAQYPQYSQENYDYNSQYNQSQEPSANSETITELIDQVVSEKLSKIRDKLEKNLDLKTTIEAKISNLDERLQRIEKIIDRLQLSILQKVGEYVVNVSDLKKELIETQKSFKALSPHHPHLPHLEHSPQHHTHHSNSSHTAHTTHKTKHKP